MLRTKYTCVKKEITRRHILQDSFTCVKKSDWATTKLCRAKHLILCTCISSTS